MSTPPITQGSTFPLSQYPWDNNAIRTDNPLRVQARSGSPDSSSSSPDLIEDQDSEEYIAKLFANLHIPSPDREERIFTSEDMQDSPEYKFRMSRGKKNTLSTKTDESWKSYARRKLDFGPKKKD